MKTNTIIIEINKPVSDVFQYTINGANTPFWVPEVLEEYATENPPRVGTFYKQKVKTKSGEEESAIVVTNIKTNAALDFKSATSNYTCSYRYEQIQEGTRLTYSEDSGSEENLSTPMTKENLEKLKQLIEES